MKRWLKPSMKSRASVWRALRRKLWGKHLDHLVSTRDDAVKAIRELLEILSDDALSASLQPLETETLMTMVSDEAVAEATHELMTTCLDKIEEESVEKHLDYSVSTNDDAAKAIRELLEILHDDALLASVQPLEKETVMTMVSDEAQAETAIDEHINLDDAEPDDDRPFGNEIMRDWMILATKSLKDILSVPLKDTEQEPEDEPLGNEIMRDWMTLPTKSLKDISGIPPKDIEQNPEKEPEDKPLEKDVISVIDAEAQPEAATDTVPVYLDETETTENQPLTEIDVKKSDPPEEEAETKNGRTRRGTRGKGWRISYNKDQHLPNYRQDADRVSESRVSGSKENREPNKSLFREILLDRTAVMNAGRWSVPDRCRKSGIVDIMKSLTP
ncbi:hypothetical protein AOLI_G00216290 [Acnodon oligacanthus]